VETSKSAIWMSLAATLVSLLGVMWLEGMILFKEPELTQAHVPIICSDTRGMSRTTMAFHETPPTRDPEHLVQIISNPFAVEKAEAQIRHFNQLIKYYGDFSKPRYRRCQSLDIRLSRALEDVQGKLFERTSGTEKPIELEGTATNIDLQTYKTVSFVGIHKSPDGLVAKTSFYEDRVGVSVFLGDLARAEPVNVVDVSIRVPKQYRIVGAFPEGGTVNHTDSNTVTYKWVVSGRGAVSGDFWVDIEHSKRKKIADILIFAAGALLGAAVSVLFSAILAVLERRRSSRPVP